jgi:hypothetical protein
MPVAALTATAGRAHLNVSAPGETSLLSHQGKDPGNSIVFPLPNAIYRTGGGTIDKATIFEIVAGSSRQ